MPYEPPPPLGGLSLEEIARLASERRLPPVEQWRPKRQGDSGMRIDAHGRWFHHGGEIRRPAMVRAFSSLLRRDALGFALVTPHERLALEVEDVPFLAVEMVAERRGRESNLAFRLNTDELVIAGPDHPLRFAAGPELRPYLLVRDGLEARLTRPLAYELAEHALAEDAGAPRIWSKGECFLLPL